jgi:hypothetical protein
MTAAVTNTAFAGPWGVSSTANLIPDRETGLGKWTVRNVSETIRTGRHLGRKTACRNRARRRLPSRALVVSFRGHADSLHCRRDGRRQVAT